MGYTQRDIINNLESFDQETYHFFIDLEHPYFLPANSGLTLYADENRWAIVFEKSGYSNTGYRGEIQLTYFGNCLINLEAKGSENAYTSNSSIIVLIDNDEIQRIEEDCNELISAEIKQVKVRNTFLNIEHDATRYETRNIKDEHYDNPKNLISIRSLIRYLSEDHPHLFSATGDELKKCLPDDLPKLMHINQWHHQSYFIYDSKVLGVKPGDYETYNMIASVLVSKDIKKWKPVLEPNNDWRNWPGAGYM